MATPKLGIKQRLQGETRAQIQSDFKDNFKGLQILHVLLQHSPHCWLKQSIVVLILILSLAGFKQS
jgi:hypothetical protein